MSEALHWLQREWAVKLSAAVESMAGEPLRIEVVSGAAGPVEADTLVWEQPLDAAPGALLWVEAPPAAWRTIGTRVLQAAGLETASDEEARGTFIELLQQSLSPLAQAIGARLEREVLAGAGSERPDSPPGVEWAPVRINLGGVDLPPLRLAISKELEEVIPFRAALIDSPKEPEPPRKPRNVEGSKTLDLLLEVELPVSVSFGRTQMRLKDAVKLTTGSIVELNRSITEPVEVIVNNCVIARGEVVVVEGNYGVRVNQIISREERLRTLF
jgi:flagellar motor switch protein FliN/FliY